MTIQSEQKSMISTRIDEDTEDTEDEGEEDEGREEEEEGEEGDSREAKEIGSGDTVFKTKDPEKSASIDTPGFVPPPGEEHKYIMTKKLVEKVRKIPNLHMICGKVDGSRTDLHDVTLFYFLRTIDEGIPNFDSYNDCDEQITQYLVVGSLQGKFLVSLNRMLVEVFKPLVQAQFRGPQLSEALKEEEPDIDEERPPSLTDIMAARSSIFRRPSEFRRISIVMAKKEADKNAEDDDDDDEIVEPKHFQTIERAKLRRKRIRTVVNFEEARSKTASKEPIVRVSVDQNRNDILYYLDRLISNVEWTLENIEGDILLTMPNIAELDDPNVTDEMLEKNKEVIEQLENVIMLWGVHIEKVLESFQQKVPQGRGPLAECDYWKDREVGLLMLVEQLKTPMAKRMLSLLSNVLSPIASNFDYFYSDLWRCYTEARDNNRFLQTILRHFKLMTESDCFKTISQAIPQLMEGMRMIWILSSYYSCEEKMVGLMERISWQLCQTVIKHLSIKDLFKKPQKVILQQTEDARAMLKSWKEAYLKNREDIEISGRGMRWEFDQNRLFKGTEYIASVCDGLNQVANVLRDFHNIFGPDLKSIISDPAQIDTIIKRVDRLIVLILDADFNIFDEYNKENWEATMSLFYEEVHFLENEAKFFIDECFLVLRSAEDALHMLLKFKDTKTRDTIHQQLLRKFDVIMQQFSKEVRKQNPPLLTYHPPMAGAIYWVRQLFHRLRRPVLIIQNIEELKHSKLKILAFSQYYEVAKQMKAYEESKYQSWADKAQYVVLDTMKRSILKMERSEPEQGVLTFPNIEKSTKNLQTIHLPKGQKSRDFGSPGSTPQGSLQKAEPVMSKPSIETASSVGTKGQVKSDTRAEVKASLQSHKDQKSWTTSSEKQAVQTQKITWMEFMSGSILVECQLRFQVNFDWEFFEIIHEAELMEQLGFELIPIVKDASIQKSRLKSDLELMEKVTDQYNGMIDKMDKADIQLLRNTLLDVEKHIQPGVMRFNWNSLNISDYAHDCEKLLKNLNSIVDQVNHMKSDLDNRINNDLQSYNLFSLPLRICNSEELLPCKVYFQEIENRRIELIAAMSTIYQSTSPILIKLESLVLETYTGKSPSMQLLYEKYEKKIFCSFIACILKNIETFNRSLMECKPIFQVDAILIASEAVIRPSPGEIYATILQNVKNLLEKLKLFPRWMNGTCLECKPQTKNEYENFATVTFFEDVMSIKVVNDNILMVQRSAHKIALEAWHYLHRWKKYSNLWSFDKNLAAEKFAATEPTLHQYDDKFSFYDNILQELTEMDLYHDFYCVRINLSFLLSGIKQHANEWKQVLGHFLLHQTVHDMNSLHLIIENYRSEVELVITGLDRFTSVMQAISDIKKTAIQAEVRYTTYQETFRTLRSHGISFPEEDEQLAYTLQRDWESLYLGALYRASTLASTSDRFSDMTQEQINAFVKELEEFAADFEANGPGSVGEDLELGLLKMDEYGKLIAKYEERRLSLINSEILFDLPATDYSVFLKVKKDYEGMELLFELYQEQKSMRDVWAQTLWVNLNPQQLMDGMDHFIREFRKLSRFVKNLSVGQALDANMKSFKNSVPLFIELKNEAMRERHWKQLMEKTGRYFDMDPDRCDGGEK
nr:dynein heavy chain 10, axonemal-like [Bombus vancouverensis nearcticus]